MAFDFLLDRRDVGSLILVSLREHGTTKRSSPHRGKHGNVYLSYRTEVADCGAGKNAMLYIHHSKNLFNYHFEEKKFMFRIISREASES